MPESKPIPDEVLVAAARDGSASAEQVMAMATECLRLRRLDRLDSRRGGQLKKLRWAAENILTKLEALARGDDFDLEKMAAREPPWLKDAAEALGFVGPDGAPLALNWTQVLLQIRQLREERDRMDARITELVSKRSR